LQILHVANQAHQIDGREGLGQPLLDRLQITFAQDVKHQPRWSITSHLSAQFAADTATGTGDEHALALQGLRDAGFFRHYRLATEQVFGFDIAQAFDAARADTQLVCIGNGQHRQACARGQIEG